MKWKPFICFADCFNWLKFIPGAYVWGNAVVWYLKSGNLSMVAQFSSILRRGRIDTSLFRRSDFVVSKMENRIGLTTSNINSVNRMGPEPCRKSVQGYSCVFLSLETCRRIHTKDWCFRIFITWLGKGKKIIQMVLSCGVSVWHLFLHSSRELVIW